MLYIYRLIYNVLWILNVLKSSLSYTAIHCEWNIWVTGDCSEPCGTGLQINTRTKNVVEKDGGTCTGQPTEEVVCKIKECPGTLIHTYCNLYVILRKFY